MKNLTFLGILSLFLLGNGFSLLSQSQKFEAENGVLTGSIAVSKSISNYSGTGYVGNFSADNDKLTFNFTLTDGGTYNLYAAYAGPYGDKINDFAINGNTTQASFKSCNSFQELLIGKFQLRAGSNSISIIKNWGWFYVDYIRIEPYTGSGTAFNIPNTLVTPNATNETKSLYKYLLDNFRNKIQSGVMTKSHDSNKIMEDVEWIKTNTGKYPALLGFDFMNETMNYSWYDKTAVIKEAVKWYRKNGLVTFCWHWRDPSHATEEFYTNKTSFDVSKISDTNSDEYKAMVRDIDIIAGYLKQLQDSVVPVLFRPLHEASGGWFWWGAKTAEPCKALWRLMFDRLVNYHGLKNLIWVWTTDASSSNLSWYPGDAYVDILGMDIYQNKGDVSSQLLNFEKVKQDFNGKKFITLSENGVIPDPDYLVADQAGWSWFMPWYGEYVTDGLWNPLTHWQKIMNHAYVVTLDEMPDLKNYPYEGPGITRTKTAEMKGFGIYINNSERSLHINVNGELSRYDCFVYDITGKLSACSYKHTGDLTLPLLQAQAGVYVVKIVSSKGIESYKVSLM